MPVNVNEVPFVSSPFGNVPSTGVGASLSTTTVFVLEVCLPALSVAVIVNT